MGNNCAPFSPTFVLLFLWGILHTEAS
jgi:hypothetical protein